MLIVDEVNGGVYRVDDRAISFSRSPVEINESEWQKQFVFSNDPCYAFINPEMINHFVHRDPAPTIVFRSTKPDAYIYACHVKITSSDNTQRGENFAFIMTHQQHYMIYEEAKRGLRPALVFAEPIGKDEADAEMQQRPRPFEIFGAVRIDGHEMQKSEREFFLELSTGSYVFRDATESMATYVRNTKRRKESVPSRLQFNSMLHVNEETKKDNYFKDLRQRALSDRTVQENVARGAQLGNKLLASLRPRPVLSNSTLDVIEMDSFLLIMESVVTRIFETRQSDTARRAFFNLCLVSKAFRVNCYSAANAILQKTKNAIGDFVNTGKMGNGQCKFEDLSNFTYATVSCPPTALVMLSHDERYLVNDYFNKRAQSSLNSSVTWARAHARDANWKGKRRTESYFDVSNPHKKARVAQIYELAT